MEVIIIGAGKVGYTLAKFLSKEEDNITIIDNNNEVLHSIVEKLDIMGCKRIWNKFKGTSGSWNKQS